MASERLKGVLNRTSDQHLYYLAVKPGGINSEVGCLPEDLFQPTLADGVSLPSPDR